MQKEQVKGLFSAIIYANRAKLKKVPLIIEAITPYVVPTDFAYFIWELYALVPNHFFLLIK